MSETVYIETSILGYLTARPGRDIVVAANIEITRERRRDFQLYDFGYELPILCTPYELLGD